MVFPSRKTKTAHTPPHEDGGQPTSNPPQPASGEKRKLSSLFRRKMAEAPTLSPAEIQAGLSRAMRTPNVKPTSIDTKSQDIDHARKALVAIEAALYAMDKGRDIITQAIEITQSARDTEELGARALLAEKYDELRLSIDAISAETDETSIQLIGPEAANLDVEMDGRARYSIACFRLNTDSGALNLSPPLSAFEDDDEIETAVIELNSALNRVEKATASFCRDAKFLMARISEASPSASPKAAREAVQTTAAQ